MDNNKIELIGAPCGHHGPYTFYKAFKYRKNGKHKILALSDFFFVKLWSDSDLMSIGELQLLWIDKNSEQILASLRLYFLPENTPEGRSDDHGEDEVLAISEKVVLRVVDLLDWITEEAHWGRGLEAIWDQECPGAKCNDAATASAAAMLVDSALDFQDVNKEKHNLDAPDPEKSAVVVLSFPRYCRYRGIMKRLEGVTNKWLHNALVMALGGFAVPGRNTRILFCKETFDYPDLEGHEQLCNHLAPNLKGRPRRKRKKRSLSPGGSESNESESSLSTVSSSVKGKQQQLSLPQSSQQHEQQPSCSKHATLVPTRRNNSLVQSRKSSRVTVSQEEKDFLAKLHAFMKTRRTPIQRVPHLGFKEIDLYAFYTKVQKLGGYNVVTSNRLWKTIYDDLGGHQGSTSAATYTRRHYERLLLPYERSIRAEKPVSRNHMKLKEDKKQGTVRSNNQASTSRPNSVAPAAKSSTTASSSKSSTSSSAKSSTPSSAKQTTESKETAIADMSKEKTADPESKSSSLRSVRAKSDKSQELSSAAPATPGKENIPVSNITEEKVEITAEPSRQSVSKQNVSKDKTAPEVIDLAVEDSPVKIGKATVPAVKKRKLDILKEGGLEVTAITSPPAVAERRQSVIQHAAPIQASDSQVSITVTPDVSHILGSPATDLASTPSPSLSYDSPTQQQTVNNGQDYNKAVTTYTSPDARLQPLSKSDVWTPPRIVQSSSMYARSETTVYGNPKENIDAPRQLLQPPGHPKPTALFRDEVLDLRVKCVQKPVVTLSRVSNNMSMQGPSRNAPRTLPKPSNSNTSYPTVGGRTVIGTLGSNLEITVVDVPKTAANSSHRNHQLPQSSQHHHLKHSQVQQKSSSSSSSSPHKLTSNRLPGKNENGKYHHYSYNNQPIHRNNMAATNGSNSPLVIPSPYPTSSSNGRGGARLQQLPSTSVSPFLHGGNSSLYPGYLRPTASGNGAKPPYLPILDPLYYASLYNSHVYPPALAAPGFVPPPMFGPSPEQLQLYKDLMNQQHSNMRFPQQNNSVTNYLGLPRDGSTSITPVNHSTNPTSK